MTCSWKFLCQRKVLRLHTSAVPHRQLSASQEHGTVLINVKGESIHSCTVTGKTTTLFTGWLEPPPSWKNPRTRHLQRLLQLGEKSRCEINASDAQNASPARTGTRTAQRDSQPCNYSSRHVERSALSCHIYKAADTRSDRDGGIWSYLSPRASLWGWSRNRRVPL